MIAKLIDGVKGNPLALVMIALLLAGVFMVREIGESAKRRDALLADLIRHCIAQGPATR